MTSLTLKVNVIGLTWKDCSDLASNVVKRIVRDFGFDHELVLYGVPRGGVPAVLLVAQHLAQVRVGNRAIKFHITEDAATANVIVDDIIDSGKTRQAFDQFNASFYALVDKTDGSSAAGWYTFPWERMSCDTGPQENIRRILEYIGEDPRREGLLETPDRVVKSYAELFSGYGKDPKDVLKTFSSDGYDEMIVVKDIEFYSVCEHHMQPFFGKAAIAYVPSGRVIGVSKLARLLELYSRRLQIQERLCSQVTEALMEVLEPQGAACVLEAKHFCMVCRGVQKQNSVMVTSSLKGVFLEPTARQEFLNLVRG